MKLDNRQKRFLISIQTNEERVDLREPTIWKKKENDVEIVD